ncbi:hypothetical protein FRC09_003620 [Ceratobasidium sp. 395]|nr:hypothetical protein FRC09_003620 [Ceratobasidium sp. 395]
MSTGMPTYSHPSAPNTPASAPCYLPEATRPNIIAHDSGGEPGGFVGGFVQRGSTLPSPVSAPGPSTQYPDEPELAAARPARYSTIGPGYQSTRDLDDPTSTTDKIANVISSSMPISDIIKILCLHGCRNLSQELDVRSCDEAPRSSGGCSVVYFGRLYNGTPVALKTVFRSGSNEEERRHLKRAARELYTWSRCDHPNVAKLLGLAEFRGQIAMVSRWMEKGDLCKHLKSNPDADRLSLCIQIASALAHLHDSIGVVHGDLKGPNVLISNHGTATLIDFGNAVLGDSDLQFTATVKDSAWTTRWAAPELFEGSKHSTETDVYALGMTILETVTGKTPYADKTDLQATRAIIQKEIPARPYADIPDTEQGNRLWGLLLECWHKDPTKRPGAGRVCERLKTFLYGGISFRPLYEEPGTY